jgi:ArsR family transcriptional regulator, arsenate/arsenite/antimonite-responsive transcriptional repressor
MFEFDDSANRLAAMFRALGHPARIEMLRQMVELGDTSCTTLTRDVDLAQSTVSEHLRVLKEAGLIEQCGPSVKSGFCVKRDSLVWLKQQLVAM